MSLLSLPLGYGRTATIESDVFTRMLTNQICDGEEVRMDKPSDYSGAVFEYMGLAESGSNIVAPVWSCIKKSYYNKRCVRIQFKAGIAWVDREDNIWG